MDRMRDLIEKTIGLEYYITIMYTPLGNKFRDVGEAAFEAGGASDGWWKEKIRRQFAQEALDKFEADELDDMTKQELADGFAERSFFHDWLREEAGLNE